MRVAKDLAHILHLARPFHIVCLIDTYSINPQRYLRTVPSHSSQSETEVCCDRYLPPMFRSSDAWISHVRDYSQGFAENRVAPGVRKGIIRPSRGIRFPVRLMSLVLDCTA
jgi:hypothetical protein